MRETANIFVTILLEACITFSNTAAQFIDLSHKPALLNWWAAVHWWATTLFQVGREMFRDNAKITPSHEF